MEDGLGSGCGKAEYSPEGATAALNSHNRCRARLQPPWQQHRANSKPTGCRRTPRRVARTFPQMQMAGKRRQNTERTQHEKYAGAAERPVLGRARLVVDGVHLGEHDAVNGVGVRPPRQVGQASVELAQLIYRVVANLDRVGPQTCKAMYDVSSRSVKPCGRRPSERVISVVESVGQRPGRDRGVIAL